jgi:hypothetical protein
LYTKFDGPVADEITGAKIPYRGGRTPMDGFVDDGGINGHPPTNGAKEVNGVNGTNGHAEVNNKLPRDV